MISIDLECRGPLNPNYPKKGRKFLDGKDPKTAQIILMGYYGGPKDFGCLESVEDIKHFFEERGLGAGYVAYNCKYELLCLYYQCGVVPIIAFDPYLALTCLPQEDKPVRGGLQDSAEYYIKAAPWKDQEFLDTIGEQPIDLVWKYNYRDIKATYEIVQPIKERLQKEGTYSYFMNVVMPAANKLAGMSANGILFDQDKAIAYQAKVLAKLDEYNARLNDCVSEHVKAWQENKLAERKAAPKDLHKWKSDPKNNFNWSSSDQRLWLFKERLGFDCRRWDKTTKSFKDSTDDEVVKRLIGQHPVFELYQRYKILEKLDGFLRQWLASVQTDGRIHCSFNQDRVELGGRISSSGPNMQQVPRPYDLKWMET